MLMNCEQSPLPPKPSSSQSSSSSASSQSLAPPPLASTPEPQPTTSTKMTTTPSPSPQPTPTQPASAETPAADPDDLIPTVVFNPQGSPTTILVPSGWTKQYNQQGFLILPTGISTRLDKEAANRDPGSDINTLSSPAVAADALPTSSSSMKKSNIITSVTRVSAAMATSEMGKAYTTSAPPSSSASSVSGTFGCGVVGYFAIALVVGLGL